MLVMHAKRMTLLVLSWSCRLVSSSRPPWLEDKLKLALRLLSHLIGGPRGAQQRLTPRIINTPSVAVQDMLPFVGPSLP